ncbi:hypothetical protein [Parachlamydia sp. AcF125]|uniref:hypothetical protein n=1 Tax=Parachlamydia sp. AcF125 TaxID=2795736 RepID=UPI001BC975CA|nr:hypothetical protein [Parachlamydia sp. AcF125]MBS4168040.1 hypothetical protein [Parachlamydia sp. AcF125]
MISPNLLGCMETWAFGSITPDNIKYILLPQSLEPFKDSLRCGAAQLIFVSTISIKIPYNVGNTTKATPTIDCPDYQSALVQLFEEEEGALFTHMLRCPTPQELG